MDDIKIIDLFFARSELAIEALDGKYGAICHNLSRSILKDQQDAEECVNDAYLGVWNAIPPHRPNPAVRLCLQDRSEYFYHALSGQYSSQAKQQLRLDNGGIGKLPFFLSLG